ncbi:MAG: cadmium-translocating P-type ATPase [Clostridium tyrobutyricum]|jgi:Cd2+/Zn2+-exporting ATPase|uniref:heavy metal translocating P-type ATPase n=1 Tax=Clostridium tyrobutyricum TaxID=1519 RepID=UPI00242E2475|nr:heavy metal translocating P-type ATPase [Clostridium tyrobutyricum]MCH4201112.1 cadmium-translocating P-type ATPase [Clostridium tyrobutyricum]MCH4238496.1 cadmium-translocating P-type ATPase [Clostridium tyrobutyricum]MCH4260341.1 cadmium-translocating P-type ATPase [Clostridium tyrobutyricum]
MSSKIKKELILDGLDCANCAAKIENKINGIDGINSALMNFVTKTLTIDVGNNDDMEALLSQVRDVVKKLEPDVIVREKIIQKSDKKVMILMGLDCANCASKIETKVKSISGVKSASVDFISKKLTLELNNKHELNSIMEEVKDIVNKIEPDVKIISEDINKGKNDKEHDEHEHSHDEGENNKKEIIRLIIGAAIFGVAVAFKFSTSIEFTLFFISYILIGGEVLLKAFRNILKGQIFDENFLMSVATIGAFSIKQFPEGVAVMLFYQVGEFIQDTAVNRSRKSITALMNIRPDYANLKVDNDLQKVSPDNVKVGDLIVVKPGEKVPLDGKIVEGKSMVDTSALTGESIPREVEVQSEILSGFINKNGLLTIEVTKEFGDSTVTKILDLVQNASGRKAPTENFMTKFARYYTPVVVIIAAALAVIPPFVVQGATFSEWLYRALVFLVISCPCALVISIPLGFFGGIGGASKKGILIKGSNYLEALNNVDIVVFDKTGTLTKGVFKVTEINAQNGIAKDELLEYAAYAESYSNHPIATSIIKEYGKEVNKNEINNYDEMSGRGIKVNVKDREVLAGNIKLMDKENISYKNIDVAGTVVHIAIDRKYAGYIIISDEVKEDSREAIQGLKQIGVKKTVMLTGDSKSIASKISEQLGLNEFYAELLPNQKVEKMEILDKEKSAKGKLLFVGDGINDAPVLARADVGIAMGGLGSDAAIEAADVVIMNDEPSKIVSAIKIAKRTRMIVWQNIIFAMVVKLIVLALGAGGVATIWEAVFADVGVTVIAVLNAMRVLNVGSVK